MVKKEVKKTKEAGKTKKIDLKGVSCPINFVKAKLHMEQLAIGEVLEIILDDGEPVENVPESFSYEGQEVLGIEPFDNEGHFVVRVKKIKDN
ncbi:MAG: sulfurtransferase TusA family protein [bacterium]|nr:sulfurtransferase TusA family protein [bacterium]